MKYKKEKNKFFVSLKTGELINESIRKIALKENISNAWINGIGAIDSIEVGYMDVESKEYKKKNFNNQYELLSLMGNITMKEDEPFIHTHITFSDTEYKVFGGHLFEAKITATGEILIMVFDTTIDRSYNEKIGIYTWCLNENN